MHTMCRCCSAISVLQVASTLRFLPAQCPTSDQLLYVNDLNINLMSSAGVAACQHPHKGLPGVAAGPIPLPRTPFLPTHSQPLTAVPPPHIAPLMSHPPACPLPSLGPSAQPPPSKLLTSLLQEVLHKEAEPIKGKAKQEDWMSSPGKSLEPTNGTSRSLIYPLLMHHRPHRYCLQTFPGLFAGW